APPILNISNATVTEGDSGTVAAVFGVTLSTATPWDVSVAYQTADGTATIADNDYAGVSGNLTIPAGMTSTTITVSVNGDTSVEPDETFQVSLGNAVNATIAAGTGTGTILNDDSPSSPTISWPNPADIVYGTALGETQLDATASVTGTF